MTQFKIGSRKVGAGTEPLIIAELGINHNGSLDIAISLADKAIKAGAEVIKHQTHIPNDEMTHHAKKIIPLNAKINIYDLISKYSLSEKKEKMLMNYIKSKKKIFISTPFSRAAVDRLGKFNIPAFKIGSGECNNYPLIEHVCKFKKPIILSTGMNSIESVQISVKIIEKYKLPYALLHCTNLYPTPAKLVRLNCMLQLKKAFPKAVIGLSDHTINNYSSYAALGLGASIIEKHYTDTKKRKGPDISASMDRDEFSNLLIASKTIFQNLKNNKKKRAAKEEKPTMRFAFASVVSIKNIKKGEKFSKKNIWVKRPGTGTYLAKDFNKILNKKAARNIKNDSFISKKDIK